MPAVPGARPAAKAACSRTFPATVASGDELPARRSFKITSDAGRRWCREPGMQAPTTLTFAQPGAITVVFSGSLGIVYVGTRLDSLRQKGSNEMQFRGSRSRFPPCRRRYAKPPADTPGTEIACANSRTVALPPLCSVLRCALLSYCFAACDLASFLRSTPIPRVVRNVPISVVGRCGGGKACLPAVGEVRVRTQVFRPRRDYQQKEVSRCCDA